MHTVTFQPGIIGIRYEGNKIVKVSPQGQAENAGVCVGWRIIKINNKIVKDDAKEIKYIIKKIFSLEKQAIISFQETTQHGSSSRMPIKTTTTEQSDIISHKNNKYNDLGKITDLFPQMVQKILIENNNKNTSSPLVSVIMSVYNPIASHLRDSINSILNQTYHNLELIIVNDGITNGTDAILIDFQTIDNRITIVSHLKNMGLVSGLKSALKIATGSLIARMDADDISLPNRIQEQVKYLIDHPDISLIGSHVELFQENKKNLQRKNQRKNDVRVIQHPVDPDMIKWTMFFYCPIAHPSVLARSNVFLQFHYKNNFAACEDYDLWFRILFDTCENKKKLNMNTVPPMHRENISLNNSNCSIKFGNIPQILIKLRKHGGGISSLKRTQQEESRTKLLQHYLYVVLNLANKPHPTIALGIGQPKYLQNISDIKTAFDLIKKLEKHLLNMSSSIGKQLIENDCTARLGELAIYAMQQWGSDPVTNLIWQQWISRNPKTMLTKLLQ